MLTDQLSAAVTSGNFTKTLRTEAYANVAASLIHAACTVVPTYSQPTVLSSDLIYTNAPTTQSQSLQLSSSLTTTLGFSLGLGLPCLLILIALAVAYCRKGAFTLDYVLSARSPQVAAMYNDNAFEKA